MLRARAILMSLRFRAVSFTSGSPSKGRTCAAEPEARDKGNSDYVWPADYQSALQAGFQGKMRIAVSASGKSARLWPGSERRLIESEYYREIAYENKAPRSRWLQRGELRAHLVSITGRRKDGP